MRSKKYLAILVSIALITGVGLGLAGMAGAATDSDTVTFTTEATIQITANNIGFGTRSPGIHTISDAKPVTVSSNKTWDCTAQAVADFSNGDSITLTIDHLKMSGQTLSTSSAVTILSSEVAGLSREPTVGTELTIPWDSNLEGEAMSATITYTAITI